jgi:SAM-dependent methyltransferase
LSEIDEIINRYRNREQFNNRYKLLNPWIYKGEQEKERAFIKWILKCSILPVENVKLLEIGCGSGGNLLQFLRLGFSPENLEANELIEERYNKARRILPEILKIIPGNALDLIFEENKFDIVFQSMVFSSILDENIKIQLANKMWTWVKTGGGILWYDFVYNNPLNKDVAGIPYHKVKEYFPHGKIKKWKITLAPPLSRILTKIHPSLYNFFNITPVFRTHILCWIQKLPSD